MPGNIPTGLLPTGLARGTTPAARSATDATGPEAARTAPGPGGQNGTATAPHLSVVPAGLAESVPGGRGHRAWCAAREACRPAPQPDLVPDHQPAGGPRRLAAGEHVGTDLPAEAPPASTVFHTAITLITTSNAAYGTLQHVTTWVSVWAKATGLPDSVMLKAAQDDVRTPVQITPAVVSAEQSVFSAFTASGLIPGHVDFKNFSYSGFNDTVGGAS
jgi:hypothetical protein